MTKSPKDRHNPIGARYRSAGVSRLLSRGLPTILCLALASGVAQPAAAEVCTLDPSPGATLLLPYFEVDVADVKGRTTLLAIQNDSPDEGTLVQIVLWSELSIPVLAFQAYLAPQGSLAFDLHDVLAGELPNTVPPAALRKECPGKLPQLRPDMPPLAPFLRDALTGKPAVASTTIGSEPMIYGRDSGSLARGFITIDAVHTCSLLIPGDSGYFQVGGRGIASNRNILRGQYTYRNPAAGLEESALLVPLEADSVDERTSLPGEYTFYAGALDSSAEDQREPIATVHLARLFTFASGLSITRGASITRESSPQLVYWRDLRGQQSPLEPGELPDWYPLGQDHILAFEANGDATELFGLTPFPVAAGRVEIGGPELPVPEGTESLVLDLNTLDGLGSVPAHPWAAQSYLAGIVSSGVEVFALDSACDPQPVDSPGS